MTGALLAGEFRDIKCQNFHAGRFVAIFFDHPGTLTVCEFEVFGGKFPSILSENVEAHLRVNTEYAVDTWNF